MNRDSMTSLIDRDGIKRNWSNKKMLETAEAFYQNLYMVCPENTEAMQDCLQELTQVLGGARTKSWLRSRCWRRPPRLSTASRTDGLSKEFYVTFWDQVGPDLLEMYGK